MTENNPTLNHSLESIFNHLKNSLNLNQIEIGPLTTPVTIHFYEKWLSQNYFGSMRYLKDHYELKKNPQKINHTLTSVITVAQSYYPVVDTPKNINPARVALYAQNNDYHYWLKDKLILIIDELKKIHPNEVFLPYVDSGPILERNWAYQNAMGWFGKNTCLIHPKHGSLFFIAEILTSLETPAAHTLEPIPDFCGKCQKCIDICPTQALISPQVLKADQCISYLTIESKEVPPPSLREKIADWFFGCDLCQTTCPWNEKVFKKLSATKTRELSTENIVNLNSEEKNDLIKYFTWLLTASHNQIQKKIFGTALSRAGAKNLKRNALIVIANRSLIELKSSVESLNISEFDELKQWTLNKLNNPTGSP